MAYKDRHSTKAELSKSLTHTLEKNIARAERDNDLIYHQDVPPISAIPSIQEISMVQSVIPAGLQDPKSTLGNEDVIFGELVPWGAKVAVGTCFEFNMSSAYLPFADFLYRNISR